MKVKEMKAHLRELGYDVLARVNNRDDISLEHLAVVYNTLKSIGADHIAVALGDYLRSREIDPLKNYIESKKS